MANEGVDSIRLCATEDHLSVGSVGLRQSLYDTDPRESNLHSSLSIDWHYEERPRLHSTDEDGESIWELEAVQALQHGIYEPSESPWGAAMVLVSRPGSEADDRLFTDYRGLNNGTAVPRYPLLRIQQALGALQGKAFCSLFDFPAAYYKAEVEERARPFRAFQTQDGHYQPTRMPFGAAKAPATQQRMVDNLLAGMKWSCALACLDDVIVFSNTFEEYLTHLRKLYIRATQRSLHFKPEKCRF
ncbi:hypothetical protein Efla_002419 [Eimeria flavescens]